MDNMNKWENDFKELKTNSDRVRQEMDNLRGQYFGSFLLPDETEAAKIQNKYNALRAKSAESDIRRKELEASLDNICRASEEKRRQQQKGFRND